MSLALFCRTLAAPRYGAVSVPPDGSGQPARDLVGDGETGGQARRFDAEQVDEAGNAVGLRALDDEVLGRPAGGLQLGPDAGVAGLQGAVAEVRVVAAD